MLVRIATSTRVVVVAPLMVANNGSNVIVDSSELTGDTYCDAESTSEKPTNESEHSSEKSVSECGKPLTVKVIPSN